MQVTWKRRHGRFNTEGFGEVKNASIRLGATIDVCISHTLDFAGETPITRVIKINIILAKSNFKKQQPESLESICSIRLGK